MENMKKHLVCEANSKKITQCLLNYNLFQEIERGQLTVTERESIVFKIEQLLSNG
jgi:hypothetical protein